MTKIVRNNGNYWVKFAEQHDSYDWAMRSLRNPLLRSSGISGPSALASKQVWQSDNEFVQLQAHWMQIDGDYIFCSSLQSFFLQGFTACLWRKCEHLLLSWFLPLPWWKLVCEKPTLEEIAPKEEAATKEDAVSKDGKDCHQGKSKLHTFAWALVWAYPSHRYGVVAFVPVFLIISLNGHSDPSDWFRAPFK